MGRLIKRRSREEVRRTNRERVASILDAARQVFAHYPYGEVSLTTVGRKAGLRKGIAEMYFPTRQDLYLRVLRETLDPWFDEIGSDIETSRDPLNPAELARAVTASLIADGERVRLLTVLSTALEYEVEVMPALEAAKWLRGRVEELGETLERQSPSLGAGNGVRLLLRLQVLLGGLPRPEALSGMFSSAMRGEAPALADLDWAREISSMAARLAGPEGGSGGVDPDGS
jgi:AcrR family transcriptional regulator